MSAAASIACASRCRPSPSRRRRRYSRILLVFAPCRFRSVRRSASPPRSGRSAWRSGSAAAAPVLSRQERPGTIVLEHVVTLQGRVFANCPAVRRRDLLVFISLHSRQRIGGAVWDDRQGAAGATREKGKGEIAHYSCILECQWRVQVKLSCRLRFSVSSDISL